MSIDVEKKFMMKHTFTDVKNMKTDVIHYGRTQYHAGVPWRIALFKGDLLFNLYIECLKDRKREDWSTDTTIQTDLLTKYGGEVTEKTRVFRKDDSGTTEIIKKSGVLNEYSVDGNLTLECHVTIRKMTGIEIPMSIKFDEDRSKKFSDVVLKVKDQKFYINKMLLSYHSTYFESLFLGNFDESKRSEVELKDIEPGDFQKFLEVLYGEPAIDDDNIEGILHLADMYDAKSVIHQCEFFYLRVSEQGLKSKFTVAVKYNMKELQQKCISELKTFEDIEKIIPEEGTHLDQELWRQLLNMSVDFHKKK